MNVAFLMYVLMVSRATAVLAWRLRTRPIAGGLGETDLPDPPGS